MPWVGWWGVHVLSIVNDYAGLAVRGLPGARVPRCLLGPRGVISPGRGALPQSRTAGRYDS